MLRLNKNRTGTNELTLTTLKTWLKIENTDDDTLLTALIIESREVIEDYVNISLVVTEISATTSYTEKFLVPYSPINEIYSVEPYNTGYTLIWNYDGFYVNIDGADVNVVIKYQAGKDDIDESLLLSWKQVASFLYENRGDMTLDEYLRTNVGLSIIRKNYIF